MQCNRGRGASKRIRGKKAKQRRKMCERKIRRQPRITKGTKVEELRADRNFLRSAVHTVGRDRSKRKGGLLDGGSYVMEFFDDFRSSLGNLLGEISWHSMMRRKDTGLAGITIVILVGG